MPGFDPFAFVGDVAKGVGDVAKGVGDIANNAAKVAAGAVDGAIKAMAPEGNEGEQKSFEDHHDEPRPIPEPQYRDCEIDAFSHMLFRMARCRGGWRLTRLPARHGQAQHASVSV